VELTGGNLLQRRGVKNEINATRGVQDRTVVTDVANVVTQARINKFVALIFLFFLISAEYANFVKWFIDKSPENGSPKRSSSTSYQ